MTNLLRRTTRIPWWRLCDHHSMYRFGPSRIAIPNAWSFSTYYRCCPRELCLKSLICFGKLSRTGRAPRDTKTSFRIAWFLLSREKIITFNRTANGREFSSSSGNKGWFKNVKFKQKKQTIEISRQVKKLKTGGRIHFWICPDALVTLLKPKWMLRITKCLRMYLETTLRKSSTRYTTDAKILLLLSTMASFLTLRWVVVSTS